MVVIKTPISPGASWTAAAGVRIRTGSRPTPRTASGDRYGDRTFIHVAVDDHSRVVYAEALPNEKADTTVGLLDRAVKAYEALGVKVEHILTDNGSNYTSKLFKARAEKLGIHLHLTRPYRPQTNGKAEAFIKTLKGEWAYSRLFTTNDECLAVLPMFFDYYNYRRPHTSPGRLPPASRLYTTS